MIVLITTTIVFCQDQSIEAFLNSYTYESNEEYSKAIAEMTKVYAENSYPLNLRLGWLNYLSGDYIKSKSYYNKAIALRPKSIEARMGIVYPLAALGNWNDVVDVYKEILKIDPNHAQANYRLSYIHHYIFKDNQTAFVYISKVLLLYPFDFDSNYLMAAIQLELGNIKEAREAILNALQYNPSSKEAKAIYEVVK